VSRFAYYYNFTGTFAGFASCLTALLLAAFTGHPFISGISGIGAGYFFEAWLFLRRPIQDRKDRP